MLIDGDDGADVSRETPAPEIKKPTVSIKEATLPAVLAVTLNLRETDKAEIFGLWYEEDPELLAEMACKSTLSYVAYTSEGVPAAAFGLLEMWPGVWSAWLFGTNDFRRVGPAVAKFYHRTIIPAWIERGGHRAEARAREGHESAIKFLEKMGGVRESTLTEYGKDKANYFMYRWRPEDIKLWAK